MSAVRPWPDMPIHTRSQQTHKHPQETSSMTVYAAPGAAGAKIAYKARYDNFIGGRFVPPVKEQYFDVVTPISGKVYTRAARSTAEDIDRKSTRLNSSHLVISYAVFCLKKKKLTK